MKEKIEQGLKNSAELKLKLIESGAPGTIVRMAEACIDSLKNGGKIILAGNGGSAADAQHIAAELVGRYLKDRKALPAVALTTDSSILTAVANDLGYENIFSRQLEAIGSPGDVFIAISTSGASLNLVNALNAAGEIGVMKICLLGKDGGAMIGLADIGLVVPSGDTPRIQEAHITIAHLVCEMIESAFTGN